MSNDTNLETGQQWRSIMDGHTLAIVEAPVEPFRSFLVRLDDSAVIMSIETDELIFDYELVVDGVPDAGAATSE